MKEVKDHLLNKDKIDIQLIGESQHDDPEQVYYLREKSNNRSSTGKSKRRSLTCNYCHKKGQIRVYCWLRKKKNQMLMSLN